MKPAAYTSAARAAEFRQAREPGLAGLGVRDLAAALAVALIVVVALCWVLADEDRSRRRCRAAGPARRVIQRVIPRSAVSSA